MASRIGKFAVDLIMDATRFIRGTKQASDAVKSMNKQMAKAAGPLKTEMDYLNKSMGPDSGMGKMMQLFVGQGVIAGFTAMAMGISRMADKAKDLSTQYGLGQISINEMQQGLAESIPLLGDLIHAAKTFVDTFTGKAVMDALRKQLGEVGGKVPALEQAVIDAQRGTSMEKLRKARDDLLKQAGERLKITREMYQNDAEHWEEAFKLAREDYVRIMETYGGTLTLKMNVGKARKMVVGFFDAVGSVYEAFGQGIQRIQRAHHKWMISQAVGSFSEWTKSWGAYAKGGYKPNIVEKEKSTWMKDFVFAWRKHALNWRPPESAGYSPSGLAMFGSAEAYSALVRHRFGGSAGEKHLANVEKNTGKTVTGLSSVVTAITNWGKNFVVTEI